MPKTYTKPHLRKFIDRAFEAANARMWIRIQRADHQERLRLLSVTDALKQAKTEIIAIIDGDYDA